MTITKKHSFLVGISLFILVVLGTILLFADGHYLPTQKPCRPISYPLGEVINTRPGQINDFTTTDSFEQVVAFYNETLTPQIGWDNWVGNNWKVEQIEENIYIYECLDRQNYTIDNTAEHGCIFVQNDNEKTIVRTILFRIGDYTPCPISPKVYEN